MGYFNNEGFDQHGQPMIGNPGMSFSRIKEMDNEYYEQDLPHISREFQNQNPGYYQGHPAPDNDYLGTYEDNINANYSLPHPKVESESDWPNKPINVKVNEEQISRMSKLLNLKIVPKRDPGIEGYQTNASFNPY